MRAYNKKKKPKHSVNKKIYKIKFNHKISGTHKRFKKMGKVLGLLPKGYIFFFKNGYGASVIKHLYSYGGTKNLWKLAVITGTLDCYNIDYNNSVANGDVRGYLTKQEVAQLLEEIKLFKED